MKDRAYDQDPGSDYFLLLTSYNLMPFNGTLYRYAVKHEKVHTGHNLMDWAPYSGKNNKWEAALPYGMQWQFDSLQKIKNTASGSQTFDWSTWQLSEPDGNFINTFSLFVPASAWFIPEAAGGFTVNSYLSLEVCTADVPVSYPSYFRGCYYCY